MEGVGRFIGESMRYAIQMSVNMDEKKTKRILSDNDFASFGDF